MSDPLGLISDAGLVKGPVRNLGAGAVAKDQGPGFLQALNEQISKVNEMQNAANEATEDWLTGKRDDIESVIMATKKADTAFKMLLQVRNKVMDAYEEVKQIRI